MLWRVLAGWILLWVQALAIAAPPPNIVLIVLDDWSVGDAGFYGNDFVETPTIDRLAAEGVVFTQAYATAPNCAPSRASLMTGLQPQRTGMFTMGNSAPPPLAEQQVVPPESKPSLAPEFLTLPRWLQQQGYHTALIGKWNLGMGARGPLAHGFDVNIGGYRGGVEQSYFAPYPQAMPGLQQAPVGEYLTDRLNAEAVHFVQQQSQDRPFFLYLAQYAPHSPWHAPEATNAYFRAKRQARCSKGESHFPCGAVPNYVDYSGMLLHVDQGIAQLLAALKQKQLLDNTLIVLTSDNGGYHFGQRFSALRGQKSDLYEGGLRVPLIFWGWGARGERQTPASLLDIFPTVAARLAQTPPPELAGQSLLPVLDGVEQPERRLYWYFPAYTKDLWSESGQIFSQRPATAIRAGSDKLIRFYEKSAPQQYQLDQDPQEQRSVYRAGSERSRALLNELETWLTATSAPLSLPARPAASAEANRQ